MSPNAMPGSLREDDRQRISRRTILRLANQETIQEAGCDRNPVKRWPRDRAHPRGFNAPRIILGPKEQEIKHE
jgi:hypothetical protein